MIKSLNADMCKVHDMHHIGIYMHFSQQVSGLWFSSMVLWYTLASGTYFSVWLPWLSDAWLAKQNNIRTWYGKVQ